MNPRPRPRALAACLAVVVLLVACGGGGGGTETAPGPVTSDDPGADRLAVQVASYDLAVGTQRFMVGVLTQDAELIGGGDVGLKFAYLGTREEETTGGVVAEATASYLPIPIAADAEEEPEIPAGPEVLTGPVATGVYAAEATFDRAGFWGVLVSAPMEGEEWTGRATFEVADEHAYPAVGDKAFETASLTVDSGAEPVSIDSRAHTGEPIPDPELHSTTVAEAIASGRPTLLLVSTPTYCVSRFCGPITEMVQELAEEYSERVNFIHLEVWENFEEQAINPGAAEWVLRNGSVFEPWVWLIDAGGTISARWDNVATRGEIEPVLQAEL